MIFFIKFALKVFFTTIFFLASSIISAEENSEIKIFIAKDIVTLNKDNDYFEAIDEDDQKKIISISEAWTPYRSVVCWYLWEYLGV